MEINRNIESLKPVAHKSFIILQFSQNYIPLFCILSAHTSKEISLCTPTLQVGVERCSGNCYLQLPVGLKLPSPVVGSATRIAAGYEHVVVFLLMM